MKEISAKGWSGDGALWYNGQRKQSLRGAMVSSARGFSLVELSIVLVILGLLTGGILSGQSLIRAAEIRSVTTEYGVYATAIQTFRDKYLAYPGDFRDATKFWGRLNNNANCASHSAAAVVTTGVCDGNGDGMLTAISSSGTGGEPNEPHQFWRHLAAAGLIEGTYTGLGGSVSSAHVVLSQNVPRSRLNNAGWGGHWLTSTSAAHYAIEYGNSFYFGGATTGNITSDPVLKPEEAWNIDTKIDDGRPAYGKVLPREWNNACAAADNGTHARTNLEASYKLADSSIRCSLVFRNIF